MAPPPPGSSTPGARGNPEDDLADCAEQLGATTDQLQALASLADHDLRSPLRTITGFAKHLLPALEEDPRNAELLDRILLAGERMRVLVDRVLVLASIGHPLRPVALSLDAVAAEAVRRVGSRPGAAQATFEIGKLPDAEGDEKLLTHVLEQLLDNAAKHGSGTVRLHAEPGKPSNPNKPGHTRLIVHDGGGGIDPDEAEALFESHRQRGDERRTGAELGLSIVRRAMEKHGGTAAVEPAPDAGGTRVVLTLPLHQPATPA